MGPKLGDGENTHAEVLQGKAHQVSCARTQKNSPPGDNEVGGGMACIFEEEGQGVEWWLLREFPKCCTQGQGNDCSAHRYIIYTFPHACGFALGTDGCLYSLCFGPEGRFVFLNALPAQVTIFVP